jgi:hypothetical protein
MMPSIPSNQLIQTEQIPPDGDYRGLRILRVQTDPIAQAKFMQREYRFLHEPDYNAIKATVTRKGMVTGDKYRVAALIHPTLKQFVNIVLYDPSNPPQNDYEALGMVKAHEQTQSDFKGQKDRNKDNYRDYLIESVDARRIPYLPVISAWQTKLAMEKTVFVAFDEDDPDAMYGLLYLPKLPVMQADGQTQTAALFSLHATKDAIKKGALEKFRITLEIELSVDEREAGQSFADRNGRGSKKNKNLVIGLDTSSALSDLRVKSVKGTVFEGRLAYGRSTSTTETATKYIVDLSTIEQMLMAVIAEGKYKPESFKHFHIDHFAKYCREFIELLDSLFAKDWVEKTPANQDPFRRLYVHGWPFALKAIAAAYHRSRIDKLGPLAAALGARDAGKTFEEAFLDELNTQQAGWQKAPTVPFDELKVRLEQIDWLRYRHHWVALTGAKMKDGKKRTFKLKATGEEKVQGQAQNTQTVISSVRDKILSASWKDLTEKVDEPIDSPSGSSSRRRTMQSDRNRHKTEDSVDESTQVSTGEPQLLVSSDLTDGIRNQI